jgi:hypothetical protein
MQGKARGQIALHPVFLADIPARATSKSQRQPVNNEQLCCTGKETCFPKLPASRYTHVDRPV